MNYINDCYSKRQQTHDKFEALIPTDLLVSRNHNEWTISKCLNEVSSEMKTQAEILFAKGVI